MTLALPAEEVLRSLPVPVVYTDVHLRVLWINPAFEQTFGYSLAEVAHRPFCSFFSDGDAQHMQRHFWTLRGTEIPKHTLWARLQRRDNGEEILVNIRSQQIEDPSGGEGWVHLIQVAREEEATQLAYMSDLFVQGWVQALHARDLETSAHTQRVARLAVQIGRELGLNDRMLTIWRWGALLHDIGKVAVPDNILRKPGPLTSAEWAVMKQHPLLAKRILEAAPFLPEEVVEIPLYHHERWDGSGYPFGLVGEQIPLSARVFAIVDVWDALRSERPYRLPWPEQRILRYLRLNAGVLFDPFLVEVFIQVRNASLPA